MIIYVYMRYLTNKTAYNPEKSLLDERFKKQDMAKGNQCKVVRYS